MIYLLLSILTSASIYLIFKWFGKKGIHVFEAIVANYLTALIIGVVMVDDLPQAVKAALLFPSWSVAGICLGAIFITVFYLMAISAQRIGVSATTIASKMSLVLTVLLFALTDPNEHIGYIKGIAIALALIGVIFSSLKEEGNSFQWKHLGWPLLILLASTLIDFSLSYYSKKPQTESELQLLSCLPFVTASFIGLVISLKHIIKREYQIRPRDFIAGVGLGIVNYGSIFFLVKTFDLGIFPKSTLLPINNLSIVVVSVTGAYFIFREKLSQINMIGLFLSLLSLIVLLFH